MAPRLWISFVEMVLNHHLLHLPLHAPLDKGATNARRSTPMKSAIAKSTTANTTIPIARQSSSTNMEEQRLQKAATNRVKKSVIRTIVITVVLVTSAMPSSLAVPLLLHQLPLPAYPLSILSVVKTRPVNVSPL